MDADSEGETSPKGVTPSSTRSKTIKFRQGDNQENSNNEVIEVAVNCIGRSGASGLIFKEEKQPARTVGVGGGDGGNNRIF